MPLLSGNLSSPTRRLTSGYDREARRLRKDGYRSSAEQLAMAGAKERLERGSIRSAEEETTAAEIGAAIDKQALRDRAMLAAIARKELQNAYNGTATVTESVATKPAETAKPATATNPPTLGTADGKQKAVIGTTDRKSYELTGKPSPTTGFGTSTDIPEPVLREADAEGRAALKEQYNRVVAANEAESARLAKEGEKADTINSILEGGTDALKAATERLQAKYATPATKPAAATGGLEPVLADLKKAAADTSVARTELQAAREAPALKEMAAAAAKPDPLAKETGEFRGKYSKEERDKARADAAKPAATPPPAPAPKKPDWLLTTSDPEYWERKHARQKSDYQTYKPYFEKAGSAVEGWINRLSSSLTGGSDPLTPEKIRARSRQ